jgi:hypothetical protein
VAVLSHDLWQRRFGGDPNIAGTQVTLNSVQYTVVGIAPEAFGAMTPDAPDVWIPLMMAGNVRPGAHVLEDGTERSLQLVGRLAPGVSREQAQAQLSCCRPSRASHAAWRPRSNHPDRTSRPPSRMGGTPSDSASADLACAARWS